MLMIEYLLFFPCPEQNSSRYTAITYSNNKEENIDTKLIDILTLFRLGGGLRSNYYRKEPEKDDDNNL